MKTFIYLLSGIGGFHYALKNLGLECIYACELDNSARECYSVNFPEVKHFDTDITSVDASTIPSFDILCAGFPCQPFSISGKQEGFSDTRGTLFFDICRVLSEKKPTAFILENVKNVSVHDDGKTLKVILQSLQTIGYNVSWKVLNAKDFGVPQNRERTIIVGHKNKTFDFDTVKKINKNPILEDIIREKVLDYLDPSEYTLIRDTVVQKSGLIFSGYLKKNIRKTGANPNNLHHSRTHKQPNRIYSSEGTHPTLSAQETSGRYWILHKGKVRKLTLDECYRLMGFSGNHLKTGTLSQKYKQIGNSVCIPMIQAVAEALLRI